MSQETLDLIEHHGTKGMKWGVRKNASRSDKKWASNIYSIHGAVAVHNNVANKMNSGEIAKLNAAHPKAHLDQNTPATKAYLRAYEDLTERLTTQAVKEVHGTSPSGGYKATLGRQDGELAIVVKAVDVKHAGDFPWQTLIIPLEDNGQYIIAAKEIKERAIEQSDMQEFIEHYGKKGMKWGVRKARSQSSSDFKKTRPHRGKKPSQLTDKQLKAVNARMNLEQNYRRLNPSKIKSGLVIAGAILAVGKLGQETYNLVNSPLGKATTTLGKTVLSKTTLGKKILK